MNELLQMNDSQMFLIEGFLFFFLILLAFWYVLEIVENVIATWKEHNRLLRELAEKYQQNTNDTYSDSRDKKL